MNESNKLQVINIIERHKSDLSLREFARALIKNLDGENVSYQSIKRWLDGYCYPNRWFLVRLIRNCRDWRFDFAVEILKIIDQDLLDKTIKKLDALDQLKIARMEK